MNTKKESKLFIFTTLIEYAENISYNSTLWFALIPTYYPMGVSDGTGYLKVFQPGYIGTTLNYSMLKPHKNLKITY